MNYRPANEMEGLIHSVFAQLEHEADPQIAQLHYENQLRRFVEKETGVRRFGSQRPKSHMRTSFKLVAFLAALLLLGSWAGNIEIPGWDDGQQITLEMPSGFNATDYNHWVALFANRSRTLADKGGHSLIVDYVPAQSGGYMLQLSVLGVNYTTANEWIRDVMDSTPELRGLNYAITQPQVSYAVTVKEMLAYDLGRTDSVERRVLHAWTILNDQPTYNGMIYLIASQEQFPRRTSMLR
jgi:hypothetical protein